MYTLKQLKNMRSLFLILISQQEDPCAFKDWRSILGNVKEPQEGNFYIEILKSSPDLNELFSMLNENNEKVIMRENYWIFTNKLIEDLKFLSASLRQQKSYYSLFLPSLPSSDNKYLKNNNNYKYQPFRDFSQQNSNNWKQQQEENIEYQETLEALIEALAKNIKNQSKGIFSYITGDDESKKSSEKLINLLKESTQFKYLNLSLMNKQELDEFWKNQNQAIILANYNVNIIEEFQIPFLDLTKIKKPSGLSFRF